MTTNSETVAVRRGHRASPLSVVAAGSLLVLASCASDVGNIRLGMSRQQVIAGFGKPTLDVPEASGEVMIYSTQPMGQRVIRTKLNAAGQVQEVRETLSMQGFARVRPRQWNQDMVTNEFGPPANVRRLGGHEVWEYRYKDNGTFDALMSIFFDRQKRVIKLENGPDPLKDPNIR